MKLNLLYHSKLSMVANCHSRKPIEYPKLWERYYKMIQDGDISGVDVMKILDLKKTTFYKLINRYEEGK